MNEEVNEVQTEMLDLREEVEVCNNRHLHYPPLSLICDGMGVEIVLPPRYLRAGRGSKAKVNRVEVEVSRIRGPRNEAHERQMAIYSLKVSNDVRAVSIPRDGGHESVSRQWERADSQSDSENHYIVLVEGRLLRERYEGSVKGGWSRDASSFNPRIMEMFSWVRHKPAYERRSPTLRNHTMIDRTDASEAAGIVPIPGKMVQQLKEGDLSIESLQEIFSEWVTANMSYSLRRVTHQRGDTDETFFPLLRELGFETDISGPPMLLPEEQMRIGGLLFTRVGESKRGINGGRLTNAFDWTNAIPVLDLGGPSRVTDEESGDTYRVPSGRYLVCVAGEESWVRHPFSNIDLWQRRVGGTGRDFTRHNRFAVRLLSENLSIRVMDRALRAKRSIASDLQKDTREIKMQNRRFMRRL